MPKTIEVFSAGCSLCKETIEMVKRLSGPHQVVVHDMNTSEAAKKAKDYGVRSVPAVVIDGKLASCCSVRTRRTHAAVGSVVIGEPIETSLLLGIKTLHTDP